MLTDDGCVLNELALAGCAINTQSRLNTLRRILNRYGVKLELDELVVSSSVTDFPRKKHMLLQAMLSISDMFMLSRKNVASVFLDEVISFLDMYEVRYTENVQFTGKSGFTQSFDFGIPRSKQAPERLVKAINNPSKSLVELAIFAWNDVRQTRNREAQMLVLLNDSEKSVSQNVIAALGEYQIRSLVWSKRVEYVEDLVV